MGFRILRIGIVYIIGGYQGDVQFLAHLHQFHVYQTLFVNPMVLKL